MTINLNGALTFTLEEIVPYEDPESDNSRPTSSKSDEVFVLAGQNAHEAKINASPHKLIEQKWKDNETDFNNRPTLTKLKESIQKLLIGQVTPITLELALGYVIATQLPDWAESRLGSLMIMRLTPPVTNAIIDALMPQGKTILPKMAKWKFAYDNVLNSKQTNDHVTSLKDKGVQISLGHLKQFILNSCYGRSTPIGSMALMPIQEEGMGNVFQFAIDLMKKPENRKVIDWSETFTNSKGITQTRQQAKEGILKDYREIKQHLITTFSDLEKQSKGQNIVIRIVFFGKSGNGKTSLIERIIEATGLESVNLPQKFMASEKDTFGENYLMFAPGKITQTNSERSGFIPGELLNRTHTNFISTTQDIRWELSLKEGGIKGSAVALRFLDSDTARGKKIQLTCFAFPKDLEEKPSMDLGAIIMLNSANDTIPDTTTDLKAVKRRTKEIYVPDMSTEKKMLWTEKEVNTAFSKATREQAQKYLPFIVNVDTYLMNSGGITFVKEAYAHVHSQLESDPHRSERELKKESLEILSPGQVISMQKVNETIEQGKQAKIQMKIEFGQTLIEENEKLTSENHEKVKKYIQFSAEIDTNYLHRSDIYSFEDAVHFINETIQNNPEIEDQKIKLAILDKLIIDHPLPLNNIIATIHQKELLTA